jgi:hypothetical protein
MITPLIKTILGSLAIVIGLIGFIPYYRDIFAGKTKPHAFSWLVWSVMVGIAFAGQVVEGGGAGAWVTGTTSLATFSIFLIALKKGERNITVTDWVSLCGAVVALMIWKLTSEPLYALLLVIVIDSLGYVPTIRKSYHKPHEETLVTYFLAGFKYVFALLALDNYTLVTWLFPAFLMMTNFLFVMMLIVRRRKLETTSPSASS